MKPEKISLKNGDPCPVKDCAGILKEYVWGGKIFDYHDNSEKNKIPITFTCENNHIVSEDGHVLTEKKDNKEE